MDKNKTAFPYVLTNLNGDTEIDTGMTLRDYFANSAMQSIISVYDRRTRFKTFKDDSIDLAKASYEIADAMLKQREN